MPRSLRLPRPRPAGLALVAAASVMLLSGCTPEASEPSETTAPPVASGSAAPTAEPTGPAEPVEEPTPFAIGCDQLVTTEQMYAFNPNFG
ncbi:MAG TPA: iron ABC transporter ATP-binding protein, partial [Agromyces sp.]|nr:iron ABC transporter ATP-binding protein [Agromyces sp.]